MRGMRIEDAMTSVNQRVNLIGVVTEASIPKRSRGTDWFRSIKIIDESRTKGIYVHFFSERMETLPQVENVGDILMVSNVTVRAYDPEPYALFNKKFSYFGLFEGREYNIEELVPYHMSSKYKHPRDYNNGFMVMLRNWFHQQDITVLHESSLLREIKEAKGHTLLCKILYISNVEDNRLMLYVWDGTDAPPPPLEAKLEDEMEMPLPLQLESSVLSRDILCTFPTVGTILRMSVDHGNQMLGLQCLKLNRWVILTNVTCEVRAALWTAVLMPYSKICYLSYEERFSSKRGRMPFTSNPRPSKITETPRHPKVPFVTLMDVLTYPEVTYTFKCVVRVVAMIPWGAENFRDPNEVYRVRLTLEDPTARIHAFLYAKEGEFFFGDFQTFGMLTKKRNKLLGVANDATSTPPVENVIRNPPWIQCCLFSYCIDESDAWGTRNYRIFDTRLVDESDGFVGS
ncbi:hypothetical protein ACS0TY_015774 [Phlomoides rotata]